MNCPTLLRRRRRIATGVPPLHRLTRRANVSNGARSVRMARCNSSENYPLRCLWHGCFVKSLSLARRHLGRHADLADLVKRTKLLAATNGDILALFPEHLHALQQSSAPPEAAIRHHGRRMPSAEYHHGLLHRIASERKQPGLGRASGTRTQKLDCHNRLALPVLWVSFVALLGAERALPLTRARLPIGHQRRGRRRYATLYSPSHLHSSQPPQKVFH